MHPAIILLCVLPVALGQQATDFYCSMIGDNFDCDHRHHHSDHVYCGSDGQTYKSRCALGAAHCKDQSLHQLYEGACTNGNMTTPSHETLVHGANIVFDVFCAHLMHNNCATPVHDERVCGSNTRWYPSYCEYEKARCTHRNLHVAPSKMCPIITV